MKRKILLALVGWLLISSSTLALAQSEAASSQPSTRAQEWFERGALMPSKSTAPYLFEVKKFVQEDSGRTSLFESTLHFPGTSFSVTRAEYRFNGRWGMSGTFEEIDQFFRRAYLFSVGPTLHF